MFLCSQLKVTTILLTKITAARNAVALSYDRMRGLCFLAVFFAVTITSLSSLNFVTSIVTVVVTTP